MNDVYVGLFIIAAYTVFAALWTGWWRGRAAFWLGMPVIGVLLGLALASKWVAAYAIGALVLLILVRSALGRVLAILGMIGFTTVLGYMAISVPPRAQRVRQPDVPADHGRADAAGRGRRRAPPDRLDRRRDAASPSARRSSSGARVLRRAGDRPARQRSSHRLAGDHAAARRDRPGVRLDVVVGLFWLAGRLGLRAARSAARPRRSDPAARAARQPAEGWLRPGWLAGLPVAVDGGLPGRSRRCVYVISYIPWAFIENRHQIVPGWPPGTPARRCST